MADVNANIGIHIDSSAALAELKALQRQIATFHASIAKNSAASAAAQKGLQTNLLNSINATGQFHAQMGLVRTSTESFTHALENNKLSMREYFRYAGASTKSFGKLFRAEFDTIGKVAEERVRKMQTQYIKMGRDASGATKAMSITPTTLNMKDFGNQAAVAGQKQAIFNQLVKQGSTSLLNFGKNTQWAGRQLMVGFSVPLMYIGSIASKTFMEMEEQAIRFKRVYGDIFTSSEETDKAIKEIELLAKSFTKYGVALTDTMKMAADAAAMGKTGAELTAQVSEATRLAVLGGVEQQQSLETTISLTNAFGISADQLASKINFLNAVENQTVVSIEDLTIAIPKAGPVIKQLGGDVEDLAFFLTAMKEGGINASEGANALKSGLASLINPSKKAAAMLMDLGVNINGIVEANAGDVKNTVIGFAQALDTLDPLNRSRAIEQLFGKFQFARLSTLFQNITQDGTQASKVLGLTQASVEELAIMSERELKRVEDAVGVDFKQAVEDLKVSIMPIGKAFLEALTPIIKFAAEILKKFDGLGDGTKKFIVVATTLVGILGPTLLMTFGLVANGAANIIKLFLALRSGFLKLSGNTTVLSQQTSYLNAEQLEAATVAASLNQAHTRLTQSFNLEATAVHALRNAYVQATTAALTFARANPGMMSPGFKGPTSKKFSTGSTYVPGVGTKDTVPSMLTPGEAVIPRDVAQNPAYQPIIDAMVNGKLQGFSKGTSAVVAFGAHQPFTSAHEDIANQGKTLASVEGSEFIQYTSAGTKAKKGVVSLDTRVRQIEESVGKPPVVATDPFAVMEDLKNRGITEVKVLLGSDRMESTVFDLAAEKHGITLQKVEVPRVPGSTDDVSATKLREAVESGDLKTARKLLAKGTSAATKKLVIDEIKEHYKTEKSKVTLFDREYNARTPDGADGLRKLIDKFVPGEKANTYVFTDPKTGEQTTLSREKIIKAFDQKSQPGQKFNASSIQKRLVIGTGYRGSGVTSAKSGKISDLAKEAGYPNQIAEQEAIEKYFKERGIELTPGQKKSFFQLEQAHLIESVDSDGNKIFRAANIVPDSGWSNNYLNTAKGSIGRELLAMTDDQLKERGTDRASVERLVKGEHPNTAALAKAMRAVAVLDTQKNPTKAIAHATIAGMDYRFETGFYPATGGRPTIAELFPDDETVKAQAVEDKIFEATDEDVKKSRFKDEPVTRLGNRTQATTGYSFKEANHIGGIYTNPDGSRVFIKPMMTEDIALAEQRLTEIGRRTGLTTPEQTLRVIQDPKTGKKLFALESPYNEAFDPATIATTFSEDDYFRQVVGAGVRGDTDLKKGNLGGSVLTDVGRAGVLNKASGTFSLKTGAFDRYLTMDIPSIKEIAEKNLGGVSGPNAARSPQWFGNATVDIAKNMTPDVYQDKMLAELNRQEGIIRQALTDFNLTPQERPYYENMLTRIEEAKGVDWRELHKRHTSIVVKPDEEIENVKTGKTRKPQTESRPANIKSSSKNPKDSKIAPPLKKDEEVVQGSKAKKGKKGQKAPRVKTVRPGFADARISQADALAGLMGTPRPGMLIDEINLDALNTEAKNTTGRFKDLGHKANIASGAIAGLTMMAAFSGGKLGEIATTAMPFVFGIQGIVALLPMMKNPWVAAVAAVAALGLGMMMLVDNAKKMAQKEADYIDSVSATTNKMKKIGVITDTVGASEAMDKRRADFLPSFNNKPVTREGQQFGTTFMGSEVGKEISEGFSKSLLADRATAVKQFALQLSGYVSDGVIDGVQAGDIARQISVDFQDMSLYPSIIGQLTSIIGPDGIDILKDPIKVRLEIINQESIAAELAADQIVPNQPTEGGFNSAKSGVKDFGFGLVKDYLVGSDKTNKTAAAASALSDQALSSAKAQSDATKVQYEDDLKVLEAKKAIAKTEKERKVAQDEIDTLTSTNKDNTIKLRAEVERLLKAQQDAFNKTSRKSQESDFSVFGLFDIPAPNPAQKAFIEAGRQQVVTKYKGGNLEDSANAMLTNTKDLRSKSLEVRINALAATGTNPTNLSTLMKMFSGEGGEAALNKEIDIAVKTRGIDESVGLVGQLAFIKDADLKKELFVGINAVGDEATYTGITKTLTELLEADGKDFSVTASLKVNGVGKLIALQTKLSELEALPEPITKTTQLENIGLPPGALDAISAEWAYFMSLPEEVRKRAITSYITVYELAGSGIDSGNVGVGADAKYDQEQERKKAAAAALKARYKPGLPGGVVPPKDPVDPLDQNGNRDTTLDELLKKLKFVRDASIDAEGKLSYLMKIVSGKGITKFAGVSQQLMAGTKGGFNREFIGMLESMDNKTRDIYMRVEKGKVVLTKQGEALKVAFNEKVIGEFQDTQVRSVQDSVAQQAAFVKLKAAGVGTSTALEMVADANLAVSINAKKITSKELNELAKAAVAAKNPVSTLAIELEGVADAARLKIEDVTNQIKILTEAKTKMGFSTEDLKIISEDPILIKALEKLLNGDGTREQLGQFENLIRNTINNVKGAKVKVEGDFTALVEGSAAAAQNAVDKMQSIFNKLSSDIQKGLDIRKTSIEKEYRGQISEAQKAIDEIQNRINDGYDPATKLIIPGLQSKVDAAQEAINESNDSYDTLVKSIEETYLKETLDNLGNIVSSGLLAKPQAEVDRLTKSIEDLQNKGDINTKGLDKLGTTDAKDNLTLAEAEKAIADVEAFIEKTYSRPIEMLQQTIAGQQRTLEIRYTRSIEEIQKKIEDIQTKIAKDFEKPLSNIQEESTKLSEDLAVMDNAADAINKKYETQENALTKIAEINQDIVEQQKQQLGLADALSKGDISAAAAAVQDIRATQAAKALGSQQGTLGKAKEAELSAIKSPSGLTRDQIAERQYALERASYEIQVRRAVLEKEIQTKQDEIFAKENDPARLTILKDIKDSEDKIYELDNLRLGANNAIYLVQGQIATRNNEISAQQVLLTKAQTDLKDVEDKREAALKAAEITHAAALVGLKDKLKLAEDNLKIATDSLVIAQAALKKIEDSRAKAMAEVEADEQKFKDMVAAIDLATASTLLFEDQLTAAKNAADNLKTALEGLTKIKDAESAAEIKRKQDEEDAKAAAAKNKKTADKKILDDRIAAAKSKVTVAETALANAISNQESSTIISGLKTKLDEARKEYALSPEGIMEANANFTTPTLTSNPETIGPKGTYTEGLFLNPQLKGMNPETIAAILKGMGYYNYGGLIPEMFAAGGFSKGTDTVPAMLTPGEFVVRKAAVDKYGMNMLSALNEGYLHKGGPVGHKHGNQDGNWFSKFNPANAISSMLSGMFGFGASKAVNKNVNVQSTMTQQEKDRALLQTAQMLSGYTSAFNLKNNTSPEIFGNKKLGALADILGVLPAIGLASKVATKNPIVAPKLETFKLLKNATHASWSDNLAGKTLDPMDWKSGKADSMGRLNYLGTKETFESAGENVYKLSLPSLIKASSGKGLIKASDFQKEFGAYPGGVKPDSEIWKAFLDSKYTGVLGDIVNEVGLKMPVRYAPVKLAPKIPLEDLPRIDISEFLDSYTATSMSVAKSAPEVPVIADPVTPTIKTPTAKQGIDVSKLTPEERSFHMAGIDQDAIMAIKGADPSSMSVPDAGSSFNPGQANAGLNYLKTGGSDYKPYTAQIWELVQSQREALLRQKYPNMDFSDVKSFNEAYAQEFYGIGNEESIALFKGVHALDSPQTDWRMGDGNLGTYFSTNPYIAALYAAMLGNSKVGQELPMFMTSSMIKDLKNFLGEGAVRNGNAQGSMEFPQVLSGSQMAQTYPTPYSLPGYVYPEMFGHAPTSLKQIQDQWPFKFDQPSSITSPTPTAKPMLDPDTINLISPDTLYSINVYKKAIDNLKQDIADIKAGKYLGPGSKEPVVGDEAQRLIEAFENSIKTQLKDIEIGLKNDVPPGVLNALRDYTRTPLMAHMGGQNTMQQFSSIRTIGEDQVVYRGLSAKDMSEIVGYEPGKPWSDLASPDKENIIELITTAKAEGTYIPGTNDYKDLLPGIKIGESWVPDVIKSTTDSLDWAKTVATTSLTGGGNAGAVAKIFVDKDVLGFPNLMDLGMGGTVADLSAKEQMLAPFTEYVLKAINPLAHRIEATGNMTASKLLDEYVFEAKQTLPVPYVRISDQIEYPTMNTNPNIPSNIANDMPTPPQIIKSTISAGKLKQLQKLIDVDTFMTADGRLMMANGGFVPGLGNKDTISSMLTPGEFVIKKSAVEAYGANNLAKINDGTLPDSSVYNYSLSVNVNGNNLNPDDIASTVIQKIKYIDGQRIRGQR